VEGEAKNSWLTGTAAWTFLVVAHGILGIKPEFNGLSVDPCIPSSWPEFKVTRIFRDTTFKITVKNPHGICKGVKSMMVNGKKVEGNILTPKPGKTVKVEIVLGE
jgi:cellobiose phosphorylase